MWPKLLFILYLLLNSAWAQENEDLVSLIIATPKFPQGMLENERNQSAKIILKGTTKVPGYQIVIGNFDPSKKAKVKVHVVEVEIERVAEGILKLTAKLFDEKSKKLINKVVRERVEKIAYFRELEKLMNELFLPVEQERANDPDKREEKKKIPAARLNSPPSESEVANLDFKQRIISLKTGVDIKIKDIKEKKEEKGPSKNVAAKDNNPEKPAQTSANAQILEAEIPEKPPLKHPAFDNKKTIHKVGVLTKNVTTNSTDQIIDLDTKLQYVGVAYTYQKPVVKGRDHFYQGELELAQIQNKDVDFPPYLRLFGGYGYLFRGAGLFFRIGAELDTLSFSNLPEIGEGLQPANSRMLGGLVGAHWVGILFSQPVTLGFDYSQPFQNSADNEQIKGAEVAGNSMRMSLTLNDLYFNLNLKLEYHLANYEYKAETSQVTTKTQGLGVHINYVY